MVEIKQYSIKSCCNRHNHGLLLRLWDKHLLVGVSVVSPRLLRLFLRSHTPWLQLSFRLYLKPPDRLPDHRFCTSSDLHFNQAFRVPAFLSVILTPIPQRRYFKLLPLFEPEQHQYRPLCNYWHPHILWSYLLPSGVLAENTLYVREYPGHLPVS